MKYTKSMQAGRTSGKKRPSGTNVKLELLQYVTHDMKAPLHSILGFTENVKRKMANCKKGCGRLEDSQIDSILRELGIVIKEGEHLANMINNILDYSCLENGDGVLEKSYFAIDGIMKDILAFSEPLLQGKPLEYGIYVQEGMPLIFADRLKILQVLENLVINAVKFTSSGKITCRAEYNQELFLFSVADTGCGVPEEKKELIFNKFYRTEINNEYHIGGNGLGLAICKNIVELHSGRIWFEKASPQGTVFHFTIPGQA